MQNAAVYYFHPKSSCWCVGKLESSTDKKAVVIADNGEKVSLELHQVHKKMERPYDPSLHDLFSMFDLHPATLQFCTKERYEQLGLQYTKMGDMILSVNPFEPKAYNNPINMKKYMMEQEEAPHSWIIAHKAFKNLVVRDKGNQSILISGESGAGKTETTKTLMDYIGEFSFQNSSHAVQRQMAETVSKKLKDSNPILESFGNSKTVRNDNSSRFGKYIKLFLNNKSGVLLGAEIVTYLLEKSRIVTQSEGERGYHVFYEMLFGLSNEERAALKLTNRVTDYRSISKGNVKDRRGTDGKTVVDDGESFRGLCKAMDGVGITKDQQRQIWTVLAAILHLQNVVVGTDPGTGKAKVDSQDTLKTVADLLGVDCKELADTFLIKSKTNIMTSLATASEAEDMRDAISKGLYHAVFDWLVIQLNQTIRSGESEKYIGLLDIFGFENFKVNSFEQMCINYANESLQNHYNKYTFIEDAAECQREEISCPILDYPDNQKCLDMIQRKDTGILSLLDQQCNFKLGTDELFTENAWNTHGKEPFFIQPKSTTPTSFGIRHYAGDVTYSTKNFLEKNADNLKEEVREMLGKSTRSEFIRTLLSASDFPSAQPGVKKTSVGQKFKVQLEKLRTELGSTESHFVRCVKPNMEAKPRVIDDAYTLSQLNSSGVLHTIAMKREGFPIRMIHIDFVRRFRCIAPKDIKQKTKLARTTDMSQVSDYCNKIIQCWSKAFYYSWKPKDFAVGKTKLFMKPSILEGLEKMRFLRITKLLKKLNPYLSKYVQAKRVERERRKKQQEEELRRLQHTNNTEATVRQAASNFQSSGAGNQQAISAFQELATVFPHFDCVVVFEVVLGVGGEKSKATEILMDMQRQRLDNILPRSMTLILDLAGIRQELQEKMAAEGYSTKDFVFNMTDSDMSKLGFSQQEKEGLTRIILSQQSGWVAQERFNEIYKIQPLRFQGDAPPEGRHSSSSSGAPTGPREARPAPREDQHARIAPPDARIAPPEARLAPSDSRSKRPVESDEDMARRIHNEELEQLRRQQHQQQIQQQRQASQPGVSPRVAPQGQHVHHPPPPHGSVPRTGQGHPAQHQTVPHAQHSQLARHAPGHAPLPHHQTQRAQPAGPLYPPNSYVAATNPASLPPHAAPLLKQLQEMGFERSKCERELMNNNYDFERTFNALVAGS